MDTITISGTGLVYRNPKPYLKSIVAYHPSLVCLRENEWLATFDLGEAVESLDYHTVVARSTDAGATWIVESPLLETSPLNTTHTIRTAVLNDGSLVGLGGLHRRTDPEAGLVNRDTFGFVPVDLFLVRSLDGGRSWSKPLFIKPPLVGPAWEICHPVLELGDGRWLVPTSTWRAWDGNNPSGEQAVVMISDDRGESWPAFGRSFDGRESGLSHLEQSVIQLQDNRILAVSWVFDSVTGKSHPTEFSISTNRGETFSAHRLTGFEAQTCKVLQLREGRLLCAYRRNDRPGLWATLASVEDSAWTNLSEALLWSGAESGMTAKRQSGEELAALKFGYPSMKQASSDEVLLLFWCQEDCINNIRWIRVKIA